MRSYLYGLLVVLAAVAMSAPALAQRGRRPTVSVATARSRFRTLVDAADALRAIEVTEGDANGQIRAWDRTWAARVERASDDSGVYASGRRADCNAREVDALLGDLRIAFTNARHSLLHRSVADVRDLVAELAARRIAADEAHRRRATGLSCEDLPEHDGSGWPEVHLCRAPPRTDDHADCVSVADAIGWARDGRP